MTLLIVLAILVVSVGIGLVMLRRNPQFGAGPSRDQRRHEREGEALERRYQQEAGQQPGQQSGQQSGQHAGRQSGQPGPDDLPPTHQRG